MKTVYIFRHSALALAITSLLALGGCSGGDGAADGSLSLDVTDAPIDGAANVWVQFSGVKVRAADGTSVSFDFDIANGLIY